MNADDYAEATVEYPLSILSGVVSPAFGARAAWMQRGTLADKLRAFQSGASEATYEPKGAVSQELNRQIAQHTPKVLAEGLKSYGDWAEKNPGKAMLASAALGTVGGFAKGPISAAIGPVYRGAKNAKHLEEHTFFTEDPNYAAEYASDSRNVGANSNFVMSKYELPDKGVVDFTKDSGLRDEFLNWSAEDSKRYFKDLTPKQRLDIANEQLVGGLPLYMHRQEVVKFLKETGKDWSSIKLKEAETPRAPTSYMLRDPSMAKNLIGEKK